MAMVGRGACWALRLTLAGAALSGGAARQATAQAVIGPDTVIVASGNLRLRGLLWRPAGAGRFPAILFNHGSGRTVDDLTVGRGPESIGPLFARHGYVCLVLDSLQLGEIAAIHHGTYREGRWWWHSRGYTPAGVECLNGIRGIDYLISRPDVDPQRIAVTGISGGGAATFWIAAADERNVSMLFTGMRHFRH